jgi:hypothetical protein
LTFHGFHLLRQMGAGPLYPLDEASFGKDSIQGMKKNM